MFITPGKIFYFSLPKQVGSIVSGFFIKIRNFAQAVSKL